MVGDFLISNSIYKILLYSKCLSYLCRLCGGVIIDIDAVVVIGGRAAIIEIVISEDINIDNIIFAIAIDVVVVVAIVIVGDIAIVVVVVLANIIIDVVMM